VYHFLYSMFTDYAVIVTYSGFWIISLLSQCSNVFLLFLQLMITIIRVSFKGL